MKIKFFALFLFEELVVAASNCGAGNNCQRAIIASGYGPMTQSIRRADCSSFFSYTVFPTTVTQYTTVTTSPVTDTVTNTETDVLTSTLVVTLTQTSTTYTIPAAPTANKRARRQAVKRAATPITQIPSIVPAYASACSGTSKYSSACSCLGVTTAVITQETPTQVITVTSTVTPTVTISTIISSNLIVATSTVTVSTVLSQPVCNNNIAGHGSCNCIYGTICNASFTPNQPGALRTVSSFMDCLLLCDNNGACGSASYDPSNGNCQQYHAIITGSSVSTSGLILASNVHCSGVCTLDYDS
ncbi:hypothetical protein H072_4351 [Dactylellina haptotyla CBS 200.50]|uniref:Apple domain-containing protein n=1 Tax=Dactylellina haptotyla (strain CBS 200.50) TaxID=1284197 RepID=S8C2A2_DACHA|nr:hypothetical protein H072_4351 [Dactylellina haptotyla CBS 200.50]